MADQPSLTDNLCPAHGEPWVEGTHLGRRRCAFYVPGFGVSEDYGCPQDDAEELLWRIFGESPKEIEP